MICCLDIAILDVQPAKRNFHARHDARSRVYVYQISRRKQAFMKRYVWWVKEDLNIERMQRAASLLAAGTTLCAFERRMLRGRTNRQSCKSSMCRSRPKKTSSR